MKARRVVSKNQTLQQQVRYTGPARTSNSSQPEPESQSLMALASSSLAATVLHRHPLGKLVRLRETYAGSNVEPAATIARRLRTALDLLANEQWKRCMQECDKLLKKHPNFLCATVLRSMALFRTSPEHAVELVRSESEHAPVIDPLTLMCVVYFWMYQAQDARIVVKTISEYLNNKACYKDSDTYSAIMFVYLRYGMYKHFQQIAWTMHSQERSNRSFKSVLLSLLLMVEVCDTSGPDALGVMSISSITSNSEIGAFTAKLDARRSADCIARLGVKFMEKRIEEEKLLQNDTAGPLFDTYLIFLNKCSNFNGMLSLVEHMLTVKPPVPRNLPDDAKSAHERLHVIKYEFCRAEVFKLMGRYAEALEQYNTTILSVCEQTKENNTTPSSLNRTAASLMPHEAKESIAECIYRLYLETLNAEKHTGDGNATSSKNFAELTTRCEAVIDAVSQHHAKKADNVMTRAKILSHILALIDLHHGSNVAVADQVDAASFYAAMPFIGRDALMQCVQDMYRLTPRDSPAFYDCAKYLMRFFDTEQLSEQWQTFITDAMKSEDLLTLNVAKGYRLTGDNEDDVLSGKNAAWYRNVAVKIVLDEYLDNVVRGAERKNQNNGHVVSCNDGNYERNGSCSVGLEDADDVLGQVETLLRLYVRARAGEAADGGTGAPHNAEDFGVLAVIKLYRFALRKHDSNLLWLCTLLIAELSKSITLQKSETGEDAKPFQLVDSTQILFHFLLMNIMMRFGAVPAALEIFQSGMQVKNLQIHRFGYYLSAAATFLMPGPSGMFVSSHLCEYISLSVTEANRFVEQAIQSGNMLASVGDVLECAHHLPTLQNSLLGRSLTLHTIWQLFFMQIPQALGSSGILKRFEAYKDDLSNSLLTEVNYRNELTALNTVPTYTTDDVCSGSKRRFLQAIVRDQAIFGQLFDLFAVAFNMAFYMRQNFNDDDVAEDAESSRNSKGKLVSASTASSTAGSGGGGVTQAQLIRERVHTVYYDDMREQLMKRLGDLPKSATADMPESVEYFENRLTCPYSDPMIMVHSMGVFDTFIQACDIAKALRSVLLRADIIVTNSQLASRLGNADAQQTDTTELNAVVDELRVVVQKTVDDYKVCLANLPSRHTAILLPAGGALKFDSSSNISAFWFRRFVEEAAGIVWLVQALRLFGHRYLTVLRVSANPIKAMLMAHPSSSTSDIAAGGDVVAAAAAAPSGIVQQLMGGNAAREQSLKQQQSNKSQQQTGGRRGGGKNRSKQQQNQRAGNNSAGAPSSIQTSYNTLEQLLSPALEILDAFISNIERGAQDLLEVFDSLPFVGTRSTAPTTSSLFGEPELLSSDAADALPAEWERFRFVFAVSPDEIEKLHKSTRNRLLASWTKIADELVSVLRDKGAPIGSEPSGKAVAQYQDMQANWL